MKINIITVTYGQRFLFLEKTLNAVISDKRTDKIILVDNNSANGAEIDAYIENNQKKNIILIRNNKNEGSAGGFKKGIIEARKNKSDYVLLLDDDNIIEDGWSEHFENALNYFPNKENIILKGNRHANLNLTRFPSRKEKILTIDYLSFKRIKKLFRREKDNGIFCPMIYMPHGAIAYGGTLLPFEAIQKTEPPFEPFYLYADDVEYLFRMSKNGYEAYQLSRPFIHDIDQTFSDDSSHLGSFDKNVSLIKLFFMTRNQYALVLMTKSQTKISVIISGFLGIFAKIIYAFIKLGINDFTTERAKIIIWAAYDGIRLKFDNEKNIKKYTR